MTDAWIGVDLDGTLAEYDEWRGPNHIGGPIPLMMARVKAMIDAGKRVKIFTARASGNTHDKKIAIEAIQNWCEANGLPRLEVTNAKDYRMIACYDDRSIQMEPNTGRRIDGKD